MGLFGNPPSVILILYSIFIFVYFFGQKKWQSAWNHGSEVKAIIATAILVLIFTETLAWLNNYFAGFKNPGELFSTNYFENIVVGSGFYVGITLAWLLINRFFSFTTTQAFVTYGFLGVFLEQNGTVFNQAAMFLGINPGMSLLMMLFVFLVHGSILGLIHLRLAPQFIGVHQTLWKYPTAIIAILVGVFMGTAISGLLAKVFFF